ncbi:hypothetical protein [Aquabacterium sp. OR-4]|uniref:hypothetical protein n=1 Tax=Aquabacterium sp. OR-4 TaxID=2978127 RepID=UPI0028CAEB07|nr:hypothetical protein [Aquabacterium sp. OR-4]MDT7834850.1 hypothetical protein [Aquabacterium sp. OR-4]
MGPTGGLNDWQQRRRDDIIETLRVSVENKLPAALRAAGIAALVHSTRPPELIDWNHPSFAAAGDDWLSLRVRPVSMTQNCVNAGASCAYQLRVSLTLMGPRGQGGVLWSIEIA